MAKNDLSTVKSEIARRIDPGDGAIGESYEEIANDLGVNRGIVWKLANVDNYEPSATTLRKLNTRKEDRNRYRPDLGSDLGSRIAARAAADGMTPTEWVRDALEARLCAEEAEVKWTT